MMEQMVWSTWKLMKLNTKKLFLFETHCLREVHESKCITLLKVRLILPEHGQGGAGEGTNFQWVHGSLEPFTQRGEPTVPNPLGAFSLA